MRAYQAYETQGLLDIITHRSEAIVYRIFGDIEDDGSAPSAILIRAPNQGGMSITSEKQSRKKMQKVVK